MADYQDLTEIYDVWADSVSGSRRNQEFYLHRCLQSDGPLVELGVGTGRIAVAVAQRGRPIVGIDSCPAMLAKCRANAEAAGVGSQLDLVSGRFGDFELERPAGLITIPFKSLQHLLEREQIRRALGHIHDQLLPGGRLIFDCSVFEANRAMAEVGLPVPRAELETADGGRLLLWTAARFDFSAQTMRIYLWTDALDPQGTVLRRRYHRLDLCWIEPGVVRDLLSQVGFVVEAVFGEYDETPLTAASNEQIWIARRPG